MLIIPNGLRRSSLHFRFYLMPFNYQCPAAAAAATTTTATTVTSAAETTTKDRNSSVNG